MEFLTLPNLAGASTRTASEERRQALPSPAGSGVLGGPGGSPTT